MKRLTAPLLFLAAAVGLVLYWLWKSRGQSVSLSNVGSTFLFPAAEPDAPQDELDKWIVASIYPNITTLKPYLESKLRRDFGFSDSDFWSKTTVAAAMSDVLALDREQVILKIFNGSWGWRRDSAEQTLTLFEAASGLPAWPGWTASFYTQGGVEHYA